MSEFHSRRHCLYVKATYENIVYTVVYIVWENNHTFSLYMYIFPVVLNSSWTENPLDVRIEQVCVQWRKRKRNKSSEVMEWAQAARQQLCFPLIFCFPPFCRDFILSLTHDPSFPLPLFPLRPPIAPTPQTSARWEIMGCQEACRGDEGGRENWAQE